MALLDPEFLLNEKFNVPKTLRRDHDEIRSALRRAIMQSGPVGEAAKRLKRLCIPHFDKEEKTVYRAFALLHDAALGGVRSDMAAALPLAFHCGVWHGTFLDHHHSIACAVEALELALHEEHDSEFYELAATVKSHEKIEDEVMYPAVIWLGNYIRERLQDSE